MSKSVENGSKIGSPRVLGASRRVLGESGGPSERPLVLGIDFWIDLGVHSGNLLEPFGGLEINKK